MEGVELHNHPGTVGQTNLIKTFLRRKKLPLFTDDSRFGFWWLNRLNAKRLLADSANDGLHRCGEREARAGNGVQRLSITQITRFLSKILFLCKEQEISYQSAPEYFRLADLGQHSPVLGQEML